MTQHGPMELALARARLERPYFASALARLTLRATDAVPTAAVTDGWVLLYNPAFVERWQEACGVPWGLVLHELDHLRRKHFSRGKMLAASGDYERALLNLAMDFEINDDLEAQQVPLHPSRDLASVFVVEHRRALQQRGASIPAALEALEAYGDGGVMERYYQLLLDLEPPVPPELLCYGPTSGEDGEDSVSEAESGLIWRHVAEKTQEYAQQRGRGIVPGDLVQWAEDFLAPSPIPWRELLLAQVRRAFAERSGASDYTRKRPYRRQSAYGRVLLPGLYEPLPRVAVVFDTSGSMATHDLAKGRTEILQILKLTGVPCTVLDVDAAVHAVQQVRGSGDVQRVGRKGRGGTDMVVGIEAAMDLQPDVLIVYTDGWTPWPAVPTRCPMIALIAPGGAKDAPPSWARTVLIDSFEARA